jgi:hypothetical protein
MISNFLEEVASWQFDRPASPERMKKCTSKMTDSKPWWDLLSSTFIKLSLWLYWKSTASTLHSLAEYSHVPLDHKVTHSNGYICNNVIYRPPRLLFKPTRHLKSSQD